MQCTTIMLLNTQVNSVLDLTVHITSISQQIRHNFKHLNVALCYKAMVYCRLCPRASAALHCLSSHPLLSDICQRSLWGMWTYRQTDRHTDCNTSPRYRSGREVNMTTKSYPHLALVSDLITCCCSCQFSLMSFNVSLKQIKHSK